MEKSPRDEGRLKQKVKETDERDRQTKRLTEKESKMIVGETDGQRYPCGNETGRQKRRGKVVEGMGGGT